MFYKVLFLLSSLMVLALSSNLVFAQATGGGTGIVSPNTQAPSGGTQNPAVLQEQPDFPNYMVYPSEDLNPFGLSSIDKSTEMDYRDDSSTLGVSSKRPSNLEVNAPREKLPLKEGEEPAEEGVTDVSEEEIEDIGLSSESVSSLTSGKSGKVYTWRDDQGVLHVSNNLGSVPIKYQQQIISDTANKQ